MIHTLDDYICRSIDAEKPFETNPNLIKKVDINGDFCPLWAIRWSMIWIWM
jgi:hypothetical protein